MTEDERRQLVETASAWQANAKLFKEMAQNCCEHLKYGHQSIAITFEMNAKIIKALLI